MKPAGVYGAPSPALVAVAEDAVQFSPLTPGAQVLEAQPMGALSAMTVAAPPGTLERRFALAAALQALAPGARLTTLAPKDRGGSRLRKELESFGCQVDESAKQHQRICSAVRPEALVGIEQALAQGGPRLVETLGLWSQPGVFSWDRPDPGTELLTAWVANLSGRGADLGCGAAALSRAVLASSKVDHLMMIDIDRRAIESARRNIADARATFSWSDVRQPNAADGSSRLDFVVINPPFHDNGREDASLGAEFIRSAARLLRVGGACWLVANRKLPYESVLKAAFARSTLRVEAGGYKVYEARK